MKVTLSQETVNHINRLNSLWNTDRAASAELFSIHYKTLNIKGADGETRQEELCYSLKHIFGMKKNQSKEIPVGLANNLKPELQQHKPGTQAQLDFLRDYYENNSSTNKVSQEHIGESPFNLTDEELADVLIHLCTVKAKAGLKVSKNSRRKLAD